MNDTISIALIITGLLFNLLGCIGLLRLPDVYNRLQAATKCVTLGTWCILLSLLVKYGFSELGVKALISIPLLFLASTAAAHSLIRGSYHAGIKMWKKTVEDQYGPDIRDDLAKKAEP